MLILANREVKGKKKGSTVKFLLNKKNWAWDLLHPKCQMYPYKRVMT